MSSSDAPSLDDLISHLVAGLHAAQTLQVGAVEKLLRMSLLQLGRSIAQPPVKKRRKKMAPPSKKAASVPRDLSLVAGDSQDIPPQTGPHRSSASIVPRRPGHPASPRRRPTSRRSGNRG